MAQRKDERVVTEFRLQVDGWEGLAQNVSSRGIYFVTDAPLTVGQAVSLRFDFDKSPSGPLAVRCVARVLRLEPKDAGNGVAAELSGFEFHRLGRPREGG